jgi:hypothetical protein
MQCNRGPFIAFSLYVSSVDNKGDSDWVMDNDLMSDDGESGE